MLQQQPEVPSLPLASEDELAVYEAYLENSDQHLAAVCDYMQSYVTPCGRKSVHAILAKMLTNSLAENVNLNGSNNKIAFRSLHLYKVLQGVMLTRFPQIDMSELSCTLQKWLRNAKWRKLTT